MTLDEAYAEVFKDHEIKWSWEPAEAKSESAVQLKPGADGVSCTITGWKKDMQEKKADCVREVFDENGKQTGSATYGQIEVREPSYKYDLQTYMLSQHPQGDVPLRMVCIPEDADRP